MYVTGQDENGILKLLNSAGCWVYPKASSQIVPTAIENDLSIQVGAARMATNLSLSGPLFSGRIWAAQGAFQLSTILGPDGRTTLAPPSPAALSASREGTKWGFVELTYDRAKGLWTNVSYVDFVGLVLKTILRSSDGTTQHADGLGPDAVDGICRSLAKQATLDGQPWAQLCGRDGAQKPVSIISPNTLISTNASAFASYWAPYIDEVWRKYQGEPLWIDTQTPMGMVSCSIASDKLWCQDESFVQPSTADVFSCDSGPFAPGPSDTLLRRAIVARLCAAINRSTLLLSGGNVQPSLDSSTFYGSSPTNYYGKFVHEHENQNVGYAFPYDDVSNGRDVNPANVLASSSAQALTIIVEY